MPNFLRGGARIYAASTTPARLVAHLDAVDEEARPRTSEETNRSDNYMTTLLKLVPAEDISLYTAFRDSFSSHNALLALFLLCLAVCLILRVYASMPKTAGATWGQTQKLNVLLSCIAFFLWAHAIGPAPIPCVPLDNWLAAPLVAVFSIIAPIIAPGDRTAPGQ